mgnify:CR=1 FL=1
MNTHKMDKPTREFYTECANRQGKTLKQWLRESKKEWGV